MNSSYKPTLTGERVVLRPISASDADDMFEAACEPEGRRLTGTQAHFTRDQLHEWCTHVATAEGRVDLAIVSPEDGRFLGEAVLNDIDAVNRHCNFRIALASPGSFGRGYGSEAARLMLAYAFEELGLNRVSLEVYEFNPRALHVYRKLGFREEGRLREVHWQDGRFHDAIVMGMLRSEYEQQTLTPPG